VGGSIARHSARILAPACAIVAMVVVALLYLRWQGRVWWCTQRDFAIVSWVVNSPHNSQHVFDAYSLSHILHGILFYGLLWLFRAWISRPWRLVIASAIEIAWEMMENSPLIINRYRAATISLGYEGDSIINSLGDMVSFVMGFYIAGWIGLWWSIGAFVVIELALLWWIRDNLVLNMLMLLWPIDAIRRWQSGG
jgi:hypothetical protein